MGEINKKTAEQTLHTEGRDSQAEGSDVTRWGQQGSEDQETTTVKLGVKWESTRARGETDSKIIMVLNQSEQEE